MMLFAEAMGGVSTRSSLEVMLDNLRRKDEQPKDLPPALPIRPISRGRLPTSRRPFRANFILKNGVEKMHLFTSERKAEANEDDDHNSGVVGGMRLADVRLVQKTPNLWLMNLENCAQKLEEDNFDGYRRSSDSLTVNLGGYFKFGEAIEYISKEELPVWGWLPEDSWECGKIKSAAVNAILRLPFENILPANPKINSGVNDMALLGYLNEPSVLHNLKYRFSRDMFYTKECPILIALSSCKDLSLQENKSAAVCQKNVGGSPHLFAVADHAYQEILRGGKNQSIIISGECGSGKTEVSKMTIRFLVSVASSDGIDVEILKAISILESFGNAKTSKNDDSSRFSKFIELHFSQAGKICGAEIKTFLLEKSRVIQRATCERSDHFFYQLCAGASPWLKAVINTATLLGCDVNALVLALSTQNCYNGDDNIVQKLTLSQAIDSRDAFAKSLYGTPFEWVVGLINKSLKVGNTQIGSSISILDLCGSESSHKNGFAQFCRNYANERKQQHYISCLLKHEQELAVLETVRARTLQGILYVQKYFHDNQARCVYADIKKGVTTLQSFIRAEAARQTFHFLLRQHRAVVFIQAHVKQWVARKAFAKQQKHVLLLQSVIRSHLARNHLVLRRNLEISKCSKLTLDSDPSKKINELKQEQASMLSSDMENLKYQVHKADEEIRRLKEENSCLREEIQQYEIRWLDYDVKVKSMEQVWQKQMSSLQMSLAAAKRSLAINDVASLTGKSNLPPSSPYFDYEDTISLETCTASGTPAIRLHSTGAGQARTPDGLRNTITNLVKEFEERRQIFEDDADFIMEVKSGVSISNIDPDKEFRKLKDQFSSWKKHYKLRLRETKAALQKLGRSEGAKRLRKWWRKRISS